jgi:hypothetical protein
MIGHKVRRALEEKAAREAAGIPAPKRPRTPKRLIYDVVSGTRLSVTRCARCGAIRQAGSDGKLPPHKCAA